MCSTVGGTGAIVAIANAYPELSIAAFAGRRCGATRVTPCSAQCPGAAAARRCKTVNSATFRDIPYRPRLVGHQYRTKDHPWWACRPSSSASYSAGNWSVMSRSS